MRSQLFCVMQLHDVARLNEEGVRRLINCQTKEALLFFQRALESLHHLNLEMENSSYEEEAIVSCSPPPVWSSPSIPNFSEVDDTFFVCDQALLFDCQATQVDGQTTLLSSRQHRMFYSAAIAFNMGLTFHLKATTTPATASSLRKADLCYKQAILDLKESITTSSNKMMMRLFALNNHCKIQYQLKNQTELQNGLEEIRKVMFPSSAARTTAEAAAGPAQSEDLRRNHQQQQQQEGRTHKRRRDDGSSNSDHTDHNSSNNNNTPTNTTSGSYTYSSGVLGEVMVNVLVFHQQHHQDDSNVGIPSSSFLEPPAAAA